MELNVGEFYGYRCLMVKIVKLRKTRVLLEVDEEERRKFWLTVSSFSREAVHAPDYTPDYLTA